MRCLILYAAFLSAVAGRSLQANSIFQPEIDTTLREDISTEAASSPAAPSSSSSTTISSSIADPAQPSTAASAAPPPSSSSSSSPSSIQTNPLQESSSSSSSSPILEEIDVSGLAQRRMVTYDQRQEGQYNIRADLDNFMILLIPPGSSDGLGLLDLLGKTSLRRSSHSSKGKKKYYSSTGALKPDALKHLNYLHTQDQQYGGVSRVGEFIEGRTPYHVDIGSLNDEEAQPRLNPDRQVDVLPPSYPLAYQHHLMKPYHLEAESSLLPPSELGLQQGTQDATPSKNSGFYRFARYIRGDNFLDSNRVTSSNRLGSSASSSSSFRRQQLPIYRSDLSMGAAQLYPPLDVPHFSYHVARNFGSKSSASPLPNDVDSKQTLDSDLSYSEIIIPPAHLPLEDDLELALNDDSLLEGEAKALLSDGIERCAPGKRRDSYGVCREIEGY